MRATTRLRETCARLVDDAHAAAGDLSQELVIAEVADARQGTGAVATNFRIRSTGQPKGCRSLSHAVVIREERTQRFGVLRMLIEQLLSIGPPTGVDGFEVCRNDAIE